MHRSTYIHFQRLVNSRVLSAVNSKNPLERYCKNVIWVCENCYQSTAERVTLENNDENPKTETSNKIGISYNNLLDLKERIETPERHCEAYPD